MNYLKKILCCGIMLLSVVLLFNICNTSTASTASYNAHDLAAIQRLLNAESNRTSYEYTNLSVYERLEFREQNPDYKATVAEVLGWDINNPATWADYQSAKVEWTLVGGEYHLSSVYFYGSNYLIGDIDFSNCTSLKTLTLYFGKMTSLNASGCTALESLSCYDNPLKALNISGCVSLIRLVCFKTELTGIDISSCEKLNTLECYGAPIKNISELKVLPIRSFLYTENGINYSVLKNVGYSGTNPSGTIPSTEYDAVEILHVNQAVYDILQSVIGELYIRELYYESGNPLSIMDKISLRYIIQSHIKEKSITLPDGSVITPITPSLAAGFDITVYLLEGTPVITSFESPSQQMVQGSLLARANYKITVASTGKGITTVNGPGSDGNFSLSVRAYEGYRFVGFQDEQGLEGGITQVYSQNSNQYSIKINTGGNPASITAVFTDDSVSSEAGLNTVFGQQINAGQGSGGMTTPLQALMIVPNSTKTLSGTDFGYTGASATFGTGNSFPHGTATVSLTEGFNRVYVEVNADKGNTVYYCLFVLRQDASGKLNGVTVENIEINGTTLASIKTAEGKQYIVPLYGQAKEASSPSNIPINPNTKVFTDIAGHWAESNINFVTARNLFQGVGDDKFDPNGTMTRGMFVTVLARLDSADLSAYASSTLTDVKAGSWYLPAVEWALANNIAAKTGDNIFSPDQAISRIEMAVMVDNYLKYKGIALTEAADLLIFSDMQNVSAEEAAAVSRIQRAGIINGKPNNLFDPQGNATRAEVSAIFTRLAERMNSSMFTD